MSGKNHKGTATKLYYCPRCRIRWQFPYDFYAWKMGGDEEKLCPVCSIDDEIAAFPKSIPANDPRFEEKYKLIKRKKLIKIVGNYEKNLAGH